MADTLVSYSVMAFYGFVVLFALAEQLCPQRPHSVALGRRWTANLGLYGLSLLVYWLVLPMSAYAVAAYATADGIGLLAPLPGALAVVAGVLALDAWKYAEHRLYHGPDVLWRLHLVHHNDVEVDFTTAERHHPLETLAGGTALLPLVYALGIPPLAVVLYIIVAGFVALLSHANLRLPTGVDRVLRSVIVTAAVHNVHHSADRRETDSNFGLVLTWWDRAFGTYRPPSEAASADRRLGLEYFRDRRDARLDRLLWLPFVPRRARRASAEPDGPVNAAG